jgi:hypothetical protein
VKDLVVSELEVPAMNEMPQFEPIALPDVTRLDRLPPLPAWIDTRVAALSWADGMNSAGRHCSGPWLPVESLPTAPQRAVIKRHIDALQQMMEQTPEHDQASEAAMLALIEKLLQALPAPPTTAAATATDARCEAYMIALEADPHWAVAAVVRGWYRGKYGKKHDYRWQPAPAVLHELAKREAWKIMGRIRVLEDLLSAESPLTFSAEYRELMLMRLAQATHAILDTPRG